MRVRTATRRGSLIAAFAAAVLSAGVTPALAAFGELNPPGMESPPGGPAGGASYVVVADAVDTTSGDDYVYWQDGNPTGVAGVDVISPSGTYLRSALSLTTGSSTDSLAYDVPAGGLGVDGKNGVIYLLEPRSCRIEAYNVATRSDQGAFVSFGPVTNDNSCGQAIFDGVGGSLAVNQSDGSMFVSGRLHLPTGDTNKPFSTLPALIKYTRSALGKGVQGVYFGQDTGNENQPYISPPGTVRPPNAPGLALDGRDGGVWVVDEGPGAGGSAPRLHRLQKFDTSGNYVSGSAVAFPDDFRVPYNKGFAVSQDATAFAFARAAELDHSTPPNVVTPPEAELVTSTFGRLREFGTPGDGACQFHQSTIFGLVVQDYPRQFNFLSSGQLSAVMNGYKNAASLGVPQLKHFGPNGTGCNRKPVGGFDKSAPADRQEYKVGETVTFDAKGSYDPDTTIANYKWDFDGSGAYATDAGQSQTISHTFTQSGTFNVGMIPTDDEGLAGDPVVHQIQIFGDPPVARLTFSPSSPAAHQTVTFDSSSSSGSIADHKWDLDGSGAFATDTGTTATSTASFAPGDHVVGVKVIDNVGRSDSTTTTVSIPSPVRASFTYSPTGPVAASAVSFDASSSTPSQGATMTDYRWDFDGSGHYATDGGSTPRISHTFPAAGTYDVGLIVTDSTGDSSQKSVQAVTARPPLASFTYSPPQPVVGQTVTLDGSASNRDRSITDYRWDLDGSGAFASDGGSAATISTSFSTTGNHNVSLRVTDNQGRTDTATQALTVAGAPAVPGQPPSGGSGVTQPFTTPPPPDTGGDYSTLVGSFAPAPSAAAPRADAEPVRASASPGAAASLAAIHSLRVGSRGTVRVPVQCPPAPAECAGIVTIADRRGHTLGQQIFSRGRSSVGVRLGAATRRRVLTRHRLPGKVELESGDGPARAENVVLVAGGR